MIALSTGWNYAPDMDFSGYLNEVKETGVRALELGYRLTKDQLEQLLKALPASGLVVNSVHNYCPVPYDEPSSRHPSNYYRLSALDEGERQKAVAWTRRTMDTAKEVGAKIVVIHAGTVELNPDPSRALLNLYKEGKAAAEEFTAVRRQLLRVRSEQAGPYLAAVEKSLAALLEYADQTGIMLGLETRYYPDEIPNFEEIGRLLEKFPSPMFHYWHDVGHAEVNSRLGIRTHTDFLEHYHRRMIGVHLHGVKVLRDHHAPFIGDFELEPLLPYFDGVRFKVIEAHFAATKEQLAEAVKRLQG